MLGILIGFILTVVLAGVGGFFIYQRVAPMLGLPGTNQSAGTSGKDSGAGSFSQFYGSLPQVQKDCIVQAIGQKKVDGLLKNDPSMMQQMTQTDFGKVSECAPSGANPSTGGSQNGSSSTNGLLPSQQQQGSQSNGTPFGCPELKLVGATIVKSNVPFTVQNTDSKPHTIYISEAKYDFVAGEKKSITVSGFGNYTVPCDGSNYGSLNVGQ